MVGRPSTLSQEPSEPASPQGVRVGARVKDWFVSAAILNTWAQRGWFGKGFGRTILSDFSSRFRAREFRLQHFVLPCDLFFTYFFMMCWPANVVWGSLNRNPEPFVMIPRFPIRIGFESHEMGRDKISSYPRASRSQCSGQISFGLGTKTLEKPSESHQSSNSLGPSYRARLHKYWAGPNN